eukprot:3064800-Prymnesium_polylepis.1
MSNLLIMRLIVPRVHRLQSHVRTLYHQTSDQNAEAIRSQQYPVLLRGQGGLVDGGIYFAETPEEICHKAQATGVIFKCIVRLGKLKKISKSQDSSTTPVTFRQLYDSGYDSVKITGRSGLEYVVYSWDQVTPVTWERA